MQNGFKSENLMPTQITSPYNKSVFSDSHPAYYLNDTTQPDVVKIAIVGDPGVGVRSLHTRFIENRFVQNCRKYDFRIPIDFKMYDIKPGNNRIKLQVFDNCVRKTMNSAIDLIKEQYFAKINFETTKGILMCYSPDNVESFKGLSSWLKLASSYVPQNIVIYIVQLKNDLLRQSNHGANGRSRDIQGFVDPSEGKAFADSINLPFYQISALDGEGVQELFSVFFKDIEEAGKLSQSTYMANSVIAGTEMKDWANKEFAREINFDGGKIDMMRSGMGSSDRGSPLRHGDFDSANVERLKMSFFNKPNISSSFRKSRFDPTKVRLKGDTEVIFN